MKRYSQILFFIVAALLASCGGDDHFTSQRTTQFFLVDYNPAYLDVLWVVDNRSPLYDIREHLLDQSKKFFQRLDGITTSYQMGIVTSDMRFAKGQLQPLSSPVILKRNLRTLEERTSLFGTAMTQVVYNLKTGAETKGFQAAQAALSQYFVPRKGVPLVLVFISESDDTSEVPAGVTDSVAHYKSVFLGLKDGNANLLRPYAINYEKLSPTDDPKVKRCATKSNADADKPEFKDNYFTLAKDLGGKTADICAAFSEQIDLSGLRLKSLPTRFKLEKKAQAGTFLVDIFRGDEHFDLKWSYEEATNEIVFESVPPEGATIQVTYQGA